MMKTSKSYNRPAVSARIAIYELLKEVLVKDEATGLHIYKPGWSDTAIAAEMARRGFSSVGEAGVRYTRQSLFGLSRPARPAVSKKPAPVADATASADAEVQARLDGLEASVNRLMVKMEDLTNAILDIKLDLVVLGEPRKAAE